MEDQASTERTVKIKFDGQPHQVELSVFTQVLMDFAAVAKASTNATDPNAEIGITISAPERGSFVAVLQLAAAQGANLLALGANPVGVLADVVTVIGGVYGLHRWFSGRQVTEPPEVLGDGNVVVKDCDGTTVTVAKNVFNVYTTDPRVPDALTHTFGALDEDPAITGFQIEHDSKPIFVAERTEFGPMSEAPNVLTGSECAEVDEVKTVPQAHLHVVKLVLERSYTRKWEFVWMGHKISANIKDEKFFDDIEARRYAFGAGDQLLVDLEVTQEWDEQLGTHVNRAYTISRVYDVIPRSQNLGLF